MMLILPPPTRQFLAGLTLTKARNVALKFLKPFTKFSGVRMKMLENGGRVDEKLIFSRDAKSIFKFVWF